MSKWDYNNTEWSEHYNYDESSASCLRVKEDVFTGKYKAIKVLKAGDIAGWHRLNHKGVRTGWALKHRGKTYQIHRIIWCILKGHIPDGMVIDHIDGNPNNNNILNLCLKSPKQNTHNQKKRITNTSGSTGVFYIEDTNENSNRFPRWVASWYNNNGQQCKKSFSESVYIDAKEQAIKYRLQKLMELNDNGMQYTDRHIEGTING